MECDLVRNSGRTGRCQITLDKWSLYLRLLATSSYWALAGVYSFFV